MKTIKKMSKQWLEMSTEFQRALKRNDTQKVLKDMLVSTDKFPFVYDDYFNTSYNIFEKTPEELRKYLFSHNKTIAKYLNISKPHVKRVIRALIISEDGDNPIIKEMREVDYMARGWSAILEPMKLDLYYGFPNETMLLKFIKNATLASVNKQPILSAIIFDNINADGSLPRHIIYRIRMDGRLMHTTQEVRSRYWVPRALSGRSYYYYYGFVWMQDQLERSMIEILTGKNVTTPGLYVQEMPYPCYLEDK